MTDHLAAILAEDRETRPADWHKRKPARPYVEPEAVEEPPKRPAPFVSETRALPGGVRARTVQTPSMADSLDALVCAEGEPVDPELIGMPDNLRMAPGCRHIPMKVIRQ